MELCMTDGSDSTTPKEGKEKKAREMAAAAAAAATDKAINHSVTAPLHRRLLLYYIHTSTPQYARLPFPSLVDAAGTTVYGRRRRSLLLGVVDVVVVVVVVVVVFLLRAVVGAVVGSSLSSQ